MTSPWWHHLVTLEFTWGQDSPRQTRKTLVSTTANFQEKSSILEWDRVASSFVCLFLFFLKRWQIKVFLYTPHSHSNVWVRREDKRILSDSSPWNILLVANPWDSNWWLGGFNHWQLAPGRLHEFYPAWDWMSYFYPCNHNLFLLASDVPYLPSQFSHHTLIENEKNPLTRWGNIFCGNTSCFQKLNFCVALKLN